MPSLRVLDHPLPSTLSIPRPTTSSTAARSSTPSSRSSPLPRPSQNEARSEKKFEDFIRLRVGDARPQDVRPGSSGSVQLPARDPASGSGSSGSVQLEATGSSAATSDRSEGPLGAQVFGLVQSYLRSRDTTEDSLATPPVTSTRQDVQDRTEATDRLQPGPAAAAVTGPDDAGVAATDDAAVAGLNTGDDAAGPDDDGDDGGTLGLPEAEHQPSVSRRKKREENFPTRFSPRKIRGMGHKYGDTYYY